LKVDKNADLKIEKGAKLKVNENPSINNTNKPGPKKLDRTVNVSTTPKVNSNLVTNNHPVNNVVRNVNAGNAGRNVQVRAGNVQKDKKRP
jgi:hypothetical protein